MEDILAAARNQPDSVADDDSDDSDTSGEEEKDQVTAVRFTQCVFTKRFSDNYNHRKGEVTTDSAVV